MCTENGKGNTKHALALLSSLPCALLRKIPKLGSCECGIWGGHCCCFMCQVCTFSALWQGHLLIKPLCLKQTGERGMALLSNSSIFCQVAHGYGKKKSVKTVDLGPIREFYLIFQGQAFPLTKILACLDSSKTKAQRGSNYIIL